VVVQPGATRSSTTTAASRPEERDYLAAADEALATDDPWEGLAHYVRTAISVNVGSLAAIAGLIDVTPEMATLSARGDAAVDELVARAQRAGLLRPDINAVDVALLIEQLGRSPLLEQVRQQGRTELTDAATEARSRITALALDGLRAFVTHQLPGSLPGYQLFTERWARTTAPR
jgi:hypothetical protein